MTVVVSDDFTGTAGTTLESHTGAVGASWTRCASSPTGSAQIVASGSLSAQTGAGTDARYIALGVPTTVGYDLEVDFDIHDTSIPSGRPRVYVRGDATDLYANCYQIWYAGDFFYIDKIVSGVLTNLAFWAPASPFVNGNVPHMKVTVRPSGNRLEVYVGGASVMTSTDATFTAIGTVGVGFLGGDTGVRMRNFVVTDTASGAPATFTLTAAAGSYSISGKAANLLAARKLTATTGAYTIGGSSIALLRAARLALTSGAYAISGQAAGLIKSGPNSYTLTLTSGVYQITGSPVRLTGPGAATDGVVTIGGGGGGRWHGGHGGSGVSREWRTRMASLLDDALRERPAKRRRAERAVRQLVAEVVAPLEASTRPLEATARLGAVEAAIGPLEGLEAALAGVPDTSALARLQATVRDALVLARIEQGRLQTAIDPLTTDLTDEALVLLHLATLQRVRRRQYAQAAMAAASKIEQAVPGALTARVPVPMETIHERDADGVLVRSVTRPVGSSA